MKMGGFGRDNREVRLWRITSKEHDEQEVQRLAALFC